MRRLLLAAVPALALASPLSAQMDPTMPGMAMPGMNMPAKPKPALSKKKPATGATAKRTRLKARGKGSTATERATPRSSAGDNMSGMAGMNMSGGPAADASSHLAQRQSQGPSPTPGMTPGQPMPGTEMSSMPGMSPGQSMHGQNMSSMPGMMMGNMGANGAAAGQPQGQGSMAMPGMNMSRVKEMPQGMTKPLAGNAPAPPPPADHAADHIFGADAMRGSRADLGKEQGGQAFHMVLFNLAEYQIKRGGDGYRWDGQAWYGGDLNRLVLRTEGEGLTRRGVDSAEVQALYSRTIGPYWNIQGGVRYDFKPNPSRTYATVGFQGLAPNFFDTEAALFLSDKGDLLGRAEGYYDQRITQRVILQPRVELNLAAQDVPEDRIGAGLSNAELGLRLRYEIKREFAPYMGVSWNREVGKTASYARADGKDVSSTSFVVGIRTWF